MQVDAFQFNPPEAFRMEEMTIALRQESGKKGPAPSMLVQSKRARPGAPIELLAGETAAELARTLGGLENMSKTQFNFDDGGTGVVLAYDFKASTGQLRQYFVLRLHRDRLCTITITIPRTELNEASAASILKSMASVRPGPANRETP
jgi:hypothetical protein